MLSKDVNFYCRQILEGYPSSYFTQGLNKVIIGIGCEYLDASSITFNELKAKFYEYATGEKLCEYTGFFEVLSTDFIHLFENLPSLERKSYDFPLFLFASAKAYLLYEKDSKMFFKFGEKTYFGFLGGHFRIPPKNKAEFNILNDLKEEEESYKAVVEKAREYLLNGDVLQVALNKWLCIGHNLKPFDYYEALSLESPSAYMLYFPAQYDVVLDSSPELLFGIKQKEVFTVPITGTRNLDANSSLEALEKDLLSDEKELSEHRMLVDLAGNDISKFGKNTRVEKLYNVLKSRYMMHIASEIYANLRKEASIFDATGALFPAGTLGGAPKIHVLEIASGPENFNRSVYGGAVGFLSFDENVILTLIIHSAFFRDNKAYISSSAGIVLKSKTKKEYDEICAGRKALLTTFEGLTK